MIAATTPTTGAAELVRYLELLVGGERGERVELRFRRPSGPMRQRFHAVERLECAAETALWLARRHDVYVGCAPRTRRAGGRAALAPLRVLWADCDSADAAARLEGFEPAPTIVVRSGSAGNRHAYWALARPVEPDEGEQLNRRLAHALGADGGAVTGPAAILRPPGSLNHKHQPPRPVELEQLTGELFEAAQVAGRLPDPPVTTRRRAGRRPSGRDSGGDPLLELAPAVYVEALTGLRPGRDGKVSCPFHEDATPSLHVYPTAAGGWYCFGCRRGTSVYDLGAWVSNNDSQQGASERASPALSATSPSDSTSETDGNRSESQ